MLQPPKTPQLASERHHHGDVVIDNYEWLRNKEDPAVIEHLKAENSYSQARTKHLAMLREQIFEEIKGRTEETDMSVPTREGAWWYYTRTIEGQQYGIHCRAPIVDDDDWTPPVLDPDSLRDGLPGEQILLDDNVEAAGHEFYSLGSFDVSADGTLLLYAIDTEGDERYTITVRSLTGEGTKFSDEISGTASGALFDQSGSYIFYTTVDDSWRPDTVWRHTVGEASNDRDVQVFHEPDEHFWVDIGMTRSRAFLAIQVGSKVTSETWLLNSSTPTDEFTVVWPRRDGVEYSVEHGVLHGHDRLLIIHNDQAVNFELVSVSASDPQGDRRVVLPHNPTIRLEGIDAFRDFVALEYRREGMTRIAIARTPDETQNVESPTTFDDTLHEIPFDEPLFTVGIGGNPEWTQPFLRFGYGSFVTPSSVYDYDVRSGERTLRKQQAVLGNFDPSVFSQRREWALAPDGTRVPISVVYRNDLVTPGEPAPLVLYGYGSYEISIDPSFAISRLSLLDRGVVFAIAHVRGGGELGRLWYENGKKLHKKNTFTDFVAAAEHLIDQGWTQPGQLAAQGGSAGGLLMGAVANLAPRLFAGILAEVPFVDPLTSILDPSLPLTVIEWDEWGNPLDDEDVYFYMKSYSPVENIHSGPYPHILAITSLNDTRVLYVEPAKWVARLREVGADALLKIEMVAGHGGVSGRYSAWKERAFALAWLLDVIGAHPSGE